MSLPARGIVSIQSILRMKFATINPEVNACIIIKGIIILERFRVQGLGVFRLVLFCTYDKCHNL